jgi:isocitrate dehydrogenase
LLHIIPQQIFIVMTKIAVAKGDGIGPEIMDAVLKIFDAAKVQLGYEFVDMGKWVFDKGYSNGMTPDAQRSIETHGHFIQRPNGNTER